MKKHALFAPANRPATDKISKGEYDSRQSWGLLATVNLYECDIQLIKNPREIKKFIVELCEVIKMKRHGEPLIQRFAEGPLEGYSAMQFIETSSITMHFDEEKNRAFVDIFSCKYFNGETALNFCKKFFKAKSCKVQTIIRD
ncbi:MAG: S-adenosylmethionine decarboxylase [bacterium]|nr:S-adenosylmethionine decarboxylase [bacterium]